MKALIIAATGIALLTAPAFAGGSSHGNSSSTGLAINASVLTGKGGVLGTVLGSNGRGSNGLGVNATVATGNGGVLGSLLGTGNSGHRGYGW